MLNEIISLFKGVRVKNQQTWTPLNHSVVKDKVLAEKLHEIGFAVAASLDPSTLEQLRQLYAKSHSFKVPDGGMFYSVYSRDLQYRKMVHEEINDILGSLYDQLFCDYKSVINSFIVKVKGPESEFNLHQDSTGLDERQFSPLSVWIPLQDTTVENGCLSVVPKSHGMFSPFRGISFPEPFNKIQEEVKHYLTPIILKAGDVLLFDNRLVHYSPPNLTAHDRVVVMSGIFPQEADIISCFKDSSVKSDAIELIRQEDDYLLTFENFFHDCTCRPETGESIEFVDWKIEQMSVKDFQRQCAKNGIERVSHPQLISVGKSTMLSEPQLEQF
jgi:hypothetical protein